MRDKKMNRLRRCLPRGVSFHRFALPRAEAIFAANRVGKFNTAAPVETTIGRCGAARCQQRDDLETRVRFTRVTGLFILFHLFI